MNALLERLKLVPHSIHVLYRKPTFPFRKVQQHVFEVAIHSLCNPAPGEDRLLARLRARFGAVNVGVRKDAAATTVIKVLSEPLSREAGKRHIVGTIARIARQHYGFMVPVQLIEAEVSVCNGS